MRVLITGKTSYIGNNIKNWLENYNFNIDMLSLRDIDINELELNNYDILIHCSAVVHKKGKKITEAEYYKTNSLMTLNIAKRAKECGVKHFIFFSSMAVYGKNKGFITNDTEERPITSYGKSKFEAENIIKNLEDDKFIISIIRPPVVYGYNCPGNYKKISRIAVKIPFFPYVENKRSMIYIENLCEFIRLLILNPSNGIFFPQNKEYVNISLMVKSIAKEHNKYMHLSKILGYLVSLFKFSLIDKVFSSLIYDLSISNTFDFKYNVVNFDESISKTEK